MDARILLFSLIAAFLVAVLLGPLFIPLLRRLKFGQSIREEGPQGHRKKAGTPTMGGTIILLALTLSVWKFANPTWELKMVLLVCLGFGAVGFVDDFIKVVMKRNLGLTAKQKLFGQLLVAFVFFLMLQKAGYSSTVYVPGTDWGIDLGWGYLPFLLFLAVGTANAVNLTDGLDGLLAGSSAVAFGAYAVIASAYSMADVAVFCAATVGAVLGFLVFNAHPAKVFMGDTGSLALGGALAAVAVLTKTELLLALIGGLFVIEALSVIIQVISFKTRGKRVFRMSPIHHHFELGGWSEWRVVVTFWLVSVLFAGAGLYLEVFAG